MGYSFSSFRKQGEASVTISVAANEGTDERSASVFLECGDNRETIVVSQKQKNALIVSQQSYQLPAGESEVEVEVEANVAFEVQVSDTWIEPISTRSLENRCWLFVYWLTTVTTNEVEIS